MKQSLPYQPGPIGVFDSGYGGLTILSKIRKRCRNTITSIATMHGLLMGPVLLKSYTSSPYRLSTNCLRWAVIW